MFHCLFLMVFSLTRPSGSRWSSCCDVHMYVVLSQCDFCQSLSLALRSHNQFQASHWTVGLSWRGALKRRSCSELDSWIVHAWQVFNSWIVLAWSIRNRTLTPFFVTLQAHLSGISAPICRGRDSWCLLYLGFILLRKSSRNQQ